jgi:HEAT repeat protein
MTSANVPPVPEGAEDLERQGTGVLISTLKSDAESAVRRYAAYLLGKAQAPEAIIPLIEALGDQDKSVRGQAMLALVATGKAAVGPLTDAMKDPKWETRYRAAEALGKLADEKAVKPLLRGLHDNRDHVRYMAAKGLAVVGDSDAVDPLIILLKDENPFVRTITTRALATIGGKKVHAAIQAALADETDERVRAAMTDALH